MKEVETIAKSDSEYNYAEELDKLQETDILLIFAHPDDAQQFAGGTALLARQAGYRVTILDVTMGQCGSNELSAEEISVIRLREAHQSAEEMGAQYVNMGLYDGKVQNDLDTQLRIVAAVRKLKPQVIITQSLKDAVHPDHRRVAEAVDYSIAFQHTSSNYTTPYTTAEPFQQAVEVYFSDSQFLFDDERQYTKVNTIVDIREVMEEKLRLFALHSSQIHERQIAFTKLWGTIRGQQIHRGDINASGEGFVKKDGSGGKLQEMLPGKVYTL